ncbi:MAG: glucose-1-phosphate adenylyltransferase [Candidatus Hydrogenedentota bacterium]
MRYKQIVSVIMGGGKGVRLFPLTQGRCKPAVPIGGRYRLIDIPISNCINSGINKIFVLTQFNTASLHRHIERTYRFDSFSEGYCAIMAAEQTIDNTDWYQGTADAVRQNLRYILAPDPELVIILSGDQLYRMDFGELIKFHRENQAEVTICVHPVSREIAPSMGLMHVDEKLRVVQFVEKPKEPALLDQMKADPKALERCGFKPESHKLYMANMGIYLFNADSLRKALDDRSQIDFGKEVIPANIAKHRMFAYPFAGFWEDIGTIKAFYDVNMELTRRPPPFSFFDPQAPIYTRPRFLPPTKIENASIISSLISEGGFYEDCKINRCVLSDRSIVREGAILRDTYMMGADDMEGRLEREENIRMGRPDIGIGPGSIIEGAIIDKGARIGENVKIRKQSDKPDRDGACYYIRDGITIIPRRAIVPDGTEI